MADDESVDLETGTPDSLPGEDQGRTETGDDSPAGGAKPDAVPWHKDPRWTAWQEEKKSYASLGDVATLRAQLDELKALKAARPAPATTEDPYAGVRKRLYEVEPALSDVPKLVERMKQQHWQAAFGHFTDALAARGVALSQDHAVEVGDLFLRRMTAAQRARFDNGDYAAIDEVLAADGDKGLLSLLPKQATGGIPPPTPLRHPTGGTPPGKPPEKPKTFKEADELAWPRFSTSAR